MRLPIWGLIAAGAVCAGAVGPSAAMQCYTVLDRSDNVVYRGTVPPIDLSDRGNPEREAMRQRGQHLIAMDADRCPGVEFFTGTAGTSNLSVDEIVGGITPMRGRSPVGNSVTGASSSASGGGPARSAPPSAPMKKSGSY
jgi:hypothetical protein